MKIVAFVGSNRGENSNTYAVVNKLAQLVANNVPAVEVEILTSKDLPLHTCEGCAKCFVDYTCPLDKLDGFDQFKLKLESADLIILGSPVYAANVSGQMKTFIDRLSYWLHLMQLGGKPCVTVVSASSNSLVSANSYLRRMSEYLGLVVVQSILCTTDMPNMLNDAEFINHVLPKYGHEIADYLTNKKRLLASQNHEKIFKMYKSTYEFANNEINNEARRWNEKSYNQFTTFDSYLENRFNQVEEKA